MTGSIYCLKKIVRPIRDLCALCRREALECRHSLCPGGSCRWEVKYVVVVRLAVPSK